MDSEFDFRELPREAYDHFTGWLRVPIPGKHYLLAHNIGSLIDHSKKTQWLVNFGQAVLLGDRHLSHEDCKDLDKLIGLIAEISPYLVPAPEGYTQKIYRTDQIPEFLMSQLRTEHSGQRPFLEHSDN